jgi:3-deoxy-D-arabino-heptulosonate 7-phosphate (DAHP) synthase
MLNFLISSEMRHVERMNQTKNKIDVVKVGGHNINNDIFA